MTERKWRAMNRVVNQSIGEDIIYTDGSLTYTEIISQTYGGNDCKFSAGFTDHPVDNIYLRLEKPGVDATLLLLRPDEAAALAWCLSGVLYSLHLQDVVESETNADVIELLFPSYVPDDYTE